MSNFADRVKETTTTTGTGTVDLAGTTTGFDTFVTGIGNGNTCYYAIVHHTLDEWEVGIGTVTDATPDTLSRDVVFASSNAGAAVSFSAGTKDVFVTIPAEFCRHDGIADTGVVALSIKNATPGTALIPLQHAPWVLFESHAWSEDSSVDRVSRMNEKFHAFGSDATKSRLSWEWSLDGSAYVQKVYIDQGGAIAGTSYVSSGLALRVTSGLDGSILTTLDGTALTFLAAAGSIGSSNTTDPFVFTKTGTTVPTFHFRGLQLTSGSLIEGLVPASGFTGLFLNLGLSTDNLTVTTSLFSVEATGRVVAAGGVKPRETTIVSSATPTPNPALTDIYTVTALAAGATFGEPSGGTPVQGQKLIIRIKDNASPQTLAWNAIYRPIAVTLPTTTTTSKLLYVGMIFNETDQKWDVLAVSEEE